MSLTLKPAPVPLTDGLPVQYTLFGHYADPTSPERLVRPTLSWIVRNRYTLAWILWILQFFTIEGLALRRAESNVDPRTLSRHAWVWFAITHKGKFWRLRRIGLLSLMAWLTVHWMTGGWM
jgi:hypothetical protein